MVHPRPRTRAATKRWKKCRQWRAHVLTFAPRSCSLGDSAEHRRQLDAAARVTMTSHVYYLHALPGSLKIFKVIAAITSIVLLTVVDYNLNSNNPTVRPHAFVIHMVCSSFFLTSLVSFMLLLMGSTDHPCSIFYRVRGVLGNVGFIVSCMTYISQENHPGPAKPGLFAAALYVLNNLTFFGDTVIACEPTMDTPLIVESRSR